ncbi:aldehyde dehydrogenase family protein [Bacillus alkalicellulosilyticus]|uniref:aldehyde dehydrogenase family protein n=1 Tax=Alkalihalobacterium alkalicellulosilyticum TaxID=1912214 RepID=UPI000996FC28|nr:aldehyde dehydrogenase family protein [Bacillus alkalicellulosilyticus]
MENKMLEWLDQHSGNRFPNFINGEWVEPLSGETYPVYESARPTRLLGEFPASSDEDVDKAVQAAHEAFQSWKQTSASTRAAILYRFADLLEQNREELAYILSAEQGKVLAESRGEVGRAATEARFAAGEAFRIQGQTLPSENPEVKSKVVRTPLGVIAAIAPWNFPVVTPVRKIAPALAHGCTVVLKPASVTPWSAVKLAALLAEAGVPRGVVNVVFGSGKKVGNPLVEHPLVKGVSFTGSTKQGLQINGKAAGRLAKTQLEMGGKNAALILDYNNLEQATDQIVSAAFACSGQRCTAISRVIVLESQEKKLVELLTSKMEKITVGPAWDEEANIGPVINQDQFETVNSYIEIGQSEGAILTAGGQSKHRDGEGYFINPALFTGVTKEMRIAKEEIFGPVLTVLKARDVHEAIDIANDTEYGLAASIFTNSLSISEQAAESIEAGMIHINHGTASQAHMPFGGVKHSGYGAYSIGHTNQDFFTEVKAVYVKPQ